MHRININLGTNVNRIICCVWKTFFGIYLLLNYMEIYQNAFKMHLLYDISTVAKKWVSMQVIY